MTAVAGCLVFPNPWQLATAVQSRSSRNCRSPPVTATGLRNSTDTEDSEEEEFHYSPRSTSKSGNKKKVKKTRPNAGDFEDTDQEVLEQSCIAFKVRIGTEGAFPEDTADFKLVVTDVLTESNAHNGTNLKLTAKFLKLVRHMPSIITVLIITHRYLFVHRNF